MNKLLLFLISICSISFFHFSANAQIKIYVDSSIATSGNGKNWAKAFKTLNAALIKANNDSTICIINVAKGTYYPTKKSGEIANSRDSSFRILRNGIQLNGGYASGGGSRNISGNLTILSGDIGIEASDADNCYHVLTIIASPAAPSIDGNTIVDGFTIQNGNANGDDSLNINGQPVGNNNGGGVYNYAYSSTFSPEFNNCIFQNDKAVLNGGGMYNGGYLYPSRFQPINQKYDSNPFVNNCSFNSNNSENGGAVYNDAIGYGTATPAFASCSFLKNMATKCGGAIFNDGSMYGYCYPSFSNCDFTINSADSGGAVYDYCTVPPNYIFSPQNLQPIMCNFQNCIFGNNVANSDGGAISIFGTGEKSSCTNCVFDKNITAFGNGGAIFLETDDGRNSNFPDNEYIFTNCLFTNNSSPANGGAIAQPNALSQAGASYQFECTFYNNTAGNAGDSYYGSSIFHNSIVWKNKTYGKDSSLLTTNSGGQIILFHTLLQGSTISGLILDSISNLLLNKYPLFNDTTNLIGNDGKWATHDDGLELNKKSKVFNKGDNNQLSVTTDITGAPRIQCDTVDLGAYEITCFGLPSPSLIASVNNNNSIIYPNPAHWSITVNFTANDAGTILQVLNATGQSILQKQITSFSGKNTAQLDISKLSAGTYMLLIKTKSGVQTRQFIKQ